MTNTKWLPLAIVAAFALPFDAHAQVDCGAELGAKPTIATFKAALQCFSRQARPVLPPGTVVASILPPDEFYKVVGEGSAVFDPEKYSWALADGRSVARSAYAKLLGKSTIPDLRGLFLRGMNEGRSDDWRDPQQGREAGTQQPDAFTTHTHTGTLPGISATTNAAGWGAIANNYTVVGSAGGSSPVTVAPAGGPETRPRNAAVYWYIRIN